MKRTIYIISFLLFFTSCGTGPWYISRNFYTLYKEPVYTNNKYNLRTDGYYIQTGELHKNITYARNILLFYPNGYLASFNVDDRYFEKNLQHKDYEHIKDLDWYKFIGDSLIIEFYGSTRRDITTLVYYKRGKIINDSTLELKFDQFPDRLYTYKFVRDKNVPVIKNNARYLNKKWYQLKLDSSRK